jgi:hypothetical protein
MAVHKGPAAIDLGEIGWWPQSTSTSTYVSKDDADDYVAIGVEMCYVVTMLVAHTDCEKGSWYVVTNKSQRNFLGRTAASRCEVFPTFQELTPSPSSGFCRSFVSIKPPVMSENAHVSMRCVARENFKEFCRCERFKSYIINECTQKTLHVIWDTR